jgi:hypothetical protein
MLEIHPPTSRVRSNGMSVGSRGSCVNCTFIPLSRGNDPGPCPRFVLRPELICHRSRPCSPAFAPSQQRLGIPIGRCREFAETAINKSTPPDSFNNAFRMSTYEINRGGGMPSNSGKPWEIVRERAKYSKINTYARSRANCLRIRTYEKIRRWGAPLLGDCLPPGFRRRCSVLCRSSFQTSSRQPRDP